jgi:hypothetical protein
MKVSVVAVLATAALATASIVPACDRDATDTADYDLILVTTTDACLHVCWPKKHKCPKGWHPKKHGRSWTCCKKHHHHPHRFDLEEEDFEGLNEFDELD